MDLVCEGALACWLGSSGAFVPTGQPGEAGEHEPQWEPGSHTGPAGWLRAHGSRRPAGRRPRGLLWILSGTGRLSVQLTRTHDSHSKLPPARGSRPVSLQQRYLPRRRGAPRPVLRKDRSARLFTPGLSQAGLWLDWFSIPVSCTPEERAEESAPLAVTA